MVLCKYCKHAVKIDPEYNYGYDVFCNSTNEELTFELAENDTPCDLYEPMGSNDSKD